MNLLTHVRNTSETISYPYRCDSESHTAYLRAVISKSSAKHVSFVNKVLRFEPRPEGVRFVCVLGAENADYSVCSICNRLDVGGSWMEFQSMGDSSLWPASGKPMNCNFDACDSCERAMLQRIAESNRSFQEIVV